MTFSMMSIMMMAVMVTPLMIAILFLKPDTIVDARSNPNCIFIFILDTLSISFGTLCPLRAHRKKRESSQSKK
jgi:hypothetical protein